MAGARLPSLSKTEYQEMIAGDQAKIQTRMEELQSLLVQQDDLIIKIHDTIKDAKSESFVLQQINKEFNELSQKIQDILSKQPETQAVFRAIDDQYAKLESEREFKLGVASAYAEVEAMQRGMTEAIKGIQRVDAALGKWILNNEVRLVDKDLHNLPKCHDISRQPKVVEVKAVPVSQSSSQPSQPLPSSPSPPAATTPVMSSSVVADKEYESKDVARDIRNMLEAIVVKIQVPERKGFGKVKGLFDRTDSSLSGFINAIYIQPCKAHLEKKEFDKALKLLSDLHKEINSKDYGSSVLGRTPFQEELNTIFGGHKKGQPLNYLIKLGDDINAGKAPRIR